MSSLRPISLFNGLVAALSTRSPLVVSAHGSDVLGNPGGAWLHRRMLRFVSRRATLVHAVSPSLGEILTSSGAPEDRLRCFPIGIDTDAFCVVPRLPGVDGPPRLVCTRRHEPLYRNDTIVAALGVLKREGFETEATLIGGGRLLEERREQVRALGLEDQVSLPGSSRQAMSPGAAGVGHLHFRVEQRRRELIAARGDGVRSLPRCLCDPGEQVVGRGRDDWSSVRAWRLPRARGCDAPGDTGPRAPCLRTRLQPCQGRARRKSGRQPQSHVRPPGGGGERVKLVSIIVPVLDELGISMTSLATSPLRISAARWKF